MIQNSNTGKTMDIRSAYIHLFGEAATALEQLGALGPNVACIEILHAKKILQDALEKTESMVDL